MSRLPSSLKWLIDRRGRVAGEIEKIERSLSRCQALVDDLEKLKAILKSVDETLGLHEIQVDPVNIPNIRSKLLYVNLPYGEISRSILLCLKANIGARVSSDQITDFVAIRAMDFSSTPIPRRQLTISVRNRLQAMHRNGLVVRHHDTTTHTYGRWSLRDVNESATASS